MLYRPSGISNLPFTHNCPEEVTDSKDFHTSLPAAARNGSDLHLFRFVPVLMKSGQRPPGRIQGMPGIKFTNFIKVGYRKGCLSGCCCCHFGIDNVFQMSCFVVSLSRDCNKGLLSWKL
ncbi:hypothetical protein CEXT_787641 [Caerostris extrusa]|uniref:Uncharacterized protein n=1 Tax=Caerostris extrusa TaxID=172846 RepID=A0AAV4NYC6_CAEEX|nr:hypothetical protein CEXT_787641 [Caerostris extrusa]